MVESEILTESIQLFLLDCRVEMVIRSNLKLIFYPLRGVRDDRAGTACCRTSTAGGLIGNAANERSGLGSEVTRLGSELAQPAIRRSNGGGDLALHTFEVRLLFTIERRADRCRYGSSLLGGLR